MATSTTDIGHVEAPSEDDAARRRRRSLTSRWSAGHWAMVVAGLLAGLVNYTLLVGDEPTVLVAVATGDLQPGERLSEGSFELVETGLDDPGAHGLLSEGDVSAVVGHVITRRVAAGEFLSRSDLAAADSGALRTMSIPVEPSHAVGGRIRPGDRVDIVAVGDSGAWFVATDVEVVDVAERGGGGALGGLAPFSITVSLDDRAVLLVAEALRTGGIDIVRANGAAPTTARAGEAPSDRGERATVDRDDPSQVADR